LKPSPRTTIRHSKIAKVLKLSQLKRVQPENAFVRPHKKMSFSPKLRVLGVMVALLIVAGARAGAQAIILSATNSASSVLVSNNLTYTIIVTNNLAFLPGAVVSNTLSAPFQLVSVSPGPGVTFTTNASGGVFGITGFNVGTIAQMALTVKPTQVGFVTNLVEFFTPNATNAPSVSLVTQVTNTIPPQADLGVIITVPAASVIVNDTTAYRVTVTNAGPSSAPNVVLTNVLPSGVILEGNFTVVSNNVILNLGTLKSGGVTNFQFTIQPTNAGTLNLLALVGAPNVLDTNTANNTASNSITVINYLPADLVVVTNSAQIVNHQNGLIEQSILLSNVGTNDVAAVRVVVTSLTNRLFNAAGTNSGSPFVVYANTLGTNQSVTLLLQYAPRKNFPFTNSQLHAYAVPVPDLTPPVATAGTNVTITRIVSLPNGNMLVEFPAITNRTYTVVYSDNVLFSNAMIAPPSLVAPANVVQWIDYGPPATASVPAGGGSRFYRVFLNP
jgi:uncharacterized repeat protein (TIGR01451 family)